MEANLDVVEYRIILIDPASRKILGYKEDSKFRILRVSIPIATRIARQLRAELLRKWGIGAAILDFPSINEGSTPCAVAELLKTDIPVHFSAARPDEIPDRAHKSAKSPWRRSNRSFLSHRVDGRSNCLGREQDGPKFAS